MDNSHICLLDPEDGNIRKIKKDEFIRVWFDWKYTPIIENWEDMVLRQLIVAVPKK